MSDQTSRVMSLRDVASQINSDGDLDTVLRDLVRAACRHGSWDLGSIMTVDAAHGYAFVMSRYETTLLPRSLEDRWELATSPALVALQRGEPVYIRDARESQEFPGYRREAHERGYRTVLVMPMVSKDSEGRPMVLAVAARKIADVSAEDLAFMALIVHIGALAIERAHRQRAQSAAAEQLRHVLVAQGSLLREVLAGGSIEALTAMLHDLLKTPVVIADLVAGRLLAAGSPLSPSHDEAAWQQLLDGASGREMLATVRDALMRRRTDNLMLHPADGLTLEARIEPVMVDDEPVGALLFFGAIDEGDLFKLTIDSARFALSVQLMRSVIQFRFETRTLTELFFEIVERRWRDEQDIVDRARRLGLPVLSALRMLVIDFPRNADAAIDVSADAHRAVSQLFAQQHVAAHTVTVGGGLVCLVPQEESADVERIGRLAQRVASTLGVTLGHEPIVVLGETCSGLEALAKEWERCWRMIRIARSYGRSGAMGVPDLGPLPMLIGAADAADVRSFVEGAIGKVVEYDRKHASAYLETLSAYVRSGCRSQPCADAMGLHVTTLRYRLSRVADLFGIEVETPEQRFSIELALQLYQLIESSPTARPLQDRAEPHTSNAR
ncbi:helix-turn-helix domain-containing protein [Paraburkholderia phosphatilytica]|uniref:helix-turn-helix domain-containing protein n=1 Tax=Paraburkholderia phosphatilytica TaxID=2282883 RepID=UPI000E553664|nr:helix-turn-helix domain-containing protein [Paraburkholderia phosphatilytica]